MSLYIPGQRTIRQGGNYALPLQILDADRFTADDALLLDLMLDHKPRTSLEPGNIVQLVQVPPRLQGGLHRTGLAGHLPAFWKVRYVLSLWAWSILRAANERTAPTIDALITEVEHELPPHAYRRPMVYAHGYPHGAWPDSATFFAERHLRRVCINDGDINDLVEWPVVLDEAKASFHGYDTSAFHTAFHLDLAPDHYREGENIGRPFDHEAAAFDTACVLGLEEKMMVPTPVHLIGNPRWLDPDHDALV
jgi:hypothetical protein